MPMMMPGMMTGMMPGMMPGMMGMQTGMTGMPMQPGMMPMMMPGGAPPQTGGQGQVVQSSKPSSEIQQSGPGLTRTVGPLLTGKGVGKEGTLWVKGDPYRRRTNWKQKHFALQNGVLSYYAKPSKVGRWLANHRPS